jgi:O-antigen ligase/polysaccharide polymerase Wzy-like membrane protein
MQSYITKKTPSLNKFEYVGYSLLFLMLVFPSIAEMQRIKVLLLAMLVFVILIKVLKTKELWIHKKVFNITSFFVVVTLLFAAKGALADTPGALAVIRVYAFWPFVYLLLIQEMTNKSIFMKLKTTILISLIFISLYGINYILSAINIMPLIYDFNFASAEARYGIQEGYVKMESIGFNSLPFLVPFTLSIFMNNIFNKTKNSKLVIIALFLGLLVVMLSGRRAVLLVTIVSPLFLLGLKVLGSNYDAKKLLINLLKAIIPLAIALIVLFIIVAYYLEVTPAGIIELFTSGFDFSNAADVGAYLRKEQFHALVDGWMQNPLFGAGHGAATNASIRSYEQPWAYELYYLALLFQTGIIGFILYFSGIVWIYKTGIKIIRSDIDCANILLPMLVGMTCFLIASATNPYLPTFEGIWTIFFPIAVINSWLLERSSVITCSR